MKLLHLFSNHKVTGPAEPALRLAAELQKRGHDVLFAHSAVPEGRAGYIDETAAAFGLRSPAAFRLPKHFDPLALWRDARQLAALIGGERFDIIHCNLLNDHLTAALARSRAAHRPKLVRTNHDAVGMRSGLRERSLFPRRTDALIELSRRALDHDAARFRFPRERAFVVDTAIDLARFDPARALPDMRSRLGLRAEDFVLGIAARIQKRRRFRVLLEAVALARSRVPNLKLLVIGRGTQRESVAVRPAHELGLDGVVLFPGYLRGDEYVGAVAAMDVKVFLVPGTDGSCRAVREALALGKPVIAPRSRGMLPELVDDGRTGLLVGDGPADLADAVARLALDGELRRRLGQAARETALARFDPAKQAERVEQIYRGLLS